MQRCALTGVLAHLQIEKAPCLHYIDHKAFIWGKSLVLLSSDVRQSATHAIYLDTTHRAEINMSSYQDQSRYHWWDGIDGSNGLWDESKESKSSATSRPLDLSSLHLAPAAWEDWAGNPRHPRHQSHYIPDSWDAPVAPQAYNLPDWYHFAKNGELAVHLSWVSLQYLQVLKVYQERVIVSNTNLTGMLRALCLIYLLPQWPLHLDIEREIHSRHRSLLILQFDCTAQGQHHDIKLSCLEDL